MILRLQLPKKIILLYARRVYAVWQGVAKRYQLETFDLSFIRLSDRYQIPILPVVCLGNESFVLGFKSQKIG